MATRRQRIDRIARRLGISSEQFEAGEILGVLEKELSLWGTPFNTFPLMASSEQVKFAKVGKLKFAGIVGHREDRDGVRAPAPLSIGEWPFNNEIFLMVEELFKSHPEIQFKVFYRKAQGGSYSREIDDVYRRADAWIGKSKGATAEGHFNDLRTKKSPKIGVGGKETIYSGSKTGKVLAQAFHSRIPLSIKDRGLKIRKKGARGGRSVHVSKHPSILLEPFDALNPSNNRKAAELGPEGFAKWIFDSIVAYHDLVFE